MIDWLMDISGKIWKIARFFVPILAVFELIMWLIGDWFRGLIDEFKGKFEETLSNLSIDLAPGDQVMSLIAKANVIFPLTEAWEYMLLYLSIASVVLGVRWARNLIPGIS